MTETAAGSLAEPERGVATNLFADERTVVLVANSDAVNVPALRAAYGEDALFVFFNKVYKVLDSAFTGRSLLVARSGPLGANIVYRREVAEVTRLLEGPLFGGILNVRVSDTERFSSAAEFSRPDVAHLDLAADLAGFYPSSHVATTGFALALFLSETFPSTRTVLAGFTAKRSARWRLFEDHDWNFEQVVLRLLFRSGRLEIASGSSRDEESAYGRIAGRLPGVSAGDVSLVAAEVLAERLDNANGAIDELLKLTRVNARLRGWVQRLKPPTRKARAAAKAEAKPSAG